MRKRIVELIVPVLAAAIFAALNFVPFFQTAEHRIYDLFLRIKPPIPEREEILLLDVDDTAIENVGLWPWSRDYMARGLLVLRELNSSYVTFDIEYVDSSPQAVDGRFLRQQFPVILEDQLGYVQGQIQALFGALAEGQIPISDAVDFIDDLVGLTEEAKAQIRSAAEDVVQDNDAYLGRAAAFHGQAYFTVRVLTDEGTASTTTTELVELIDLEQVDATPNASLRRGEDVIAAIPPILSRGRGAGFPNVVVDPDGVRRRIDLVANVGDDYFGQLVFTPLLDWLGNPPIRVTRDTVTIEGAVLPGSEQPVDLTIPLATDGRMLINWPKAEYEDSFRHETYWRVVRDWEDETAMVERLLLMREAGYTQLFPDEAYLFQVYDYATMLQDDVMSGGDPVQTEEWRLAKAEFFNVVGQLLESDAEEALLAEYQRIIDSAELDPELEQVYRDVADEAATLYDELEAIYSEFMVNRETLREAVEGSFIIIGHVGTSTTDVGVTPFDEEYMNVGTHAAVVNTILQQDFLDDQPWWISLAAMFVLALIVTLLALVGEKQKSTQILVIGFVAIVVAIAGGIGVFLWTGVYLNMVTIAGGVFLTFIVLTAMKFVTESRERRTIHNAFDHYMSPDVVQEMIAHPERLKIGGEKRVLTAMFTDIQGFSTISEKLEPEQLTSLLNLYLGEMCDIILAEGGTIDKFEGDAIIAFWGAPRDMDDSPERACRAAIAMKKKEMELNERIVAENLAPSTLRTRIGINTGEMTVGNMGTATRFDYTAMGHNMNLAARLEGVNKQYNSQILISDNTYDCVHRRDENYHPFSTRRLDQVRVVGISEPVQLYELIDLREEVDDSQALIDELRSFNAALEVFNSRDFARAEKLFADVQESYTHPEWYPEGGPAKYYVEWCRTFRKKPPKASWDGVFNLTKK